MDLSKKKKIFEQYNTDPYSILNVSKNCSKQELDLSYQQAYSVLKRLPGQEAQIKLLKESYKLVENEISGNDNKQVVIDRNERSFYRTDFTDYTNRQALFANDTLNFKEFENQIKNKKMTPASMQYTPENVKEERLFGTGNFNIDTFNKKFEEKYTILDEDSTSEAQGLDAYSSMNYMPICSYNGLIVEDDTSSTIFKNLQPLQKNEEVKQKKKIKKNKEEDVKNLYNKRCSETVSVDTTHNFGEINKIMEQKHLNSMKSQLDSNKNMIMKNINVFPQSIVEQFNMGILVDSSTCIDGDSLVIPKGRKRE